MTWDNEIGPSDAGTSWGAADRKGIDMTESRELATTRVVDLDEVERLIKPYTWQPRLNLQRPGDILAVDAVLVSRVDGLQADHRRALVDAGNGAIEALEDAGYEHADAPKVNIGGLDVRELGDEAMRYLVHATLQLELLGKKRRDG